MTTQVKIKPIEQDVMMKADEVCKIMDISRKTLCEFNDHHKHRKILAPIRLSSRSVLYQQSRVYAFLEACRSI